MVKDGNPDSQGFIHYNEFVQRMLAVRNQSIHRPPIVRVRSVRWNTAHAKFVDSGMLCHVCVQPANPTVQHVRDLLKQPRNAPDGAVYTLEDNLQYRYKYKTTEELLAELRAE